MPSDAELGLWWMRSVGFEDLHTKHLSAILPAKFSLDGEPSEPIEAMSMQRIGTLKATAVSSTAFNSGRKLLQDVSAKGGNASGLIFDSMTFGWSGWGLLSSGSALFETQDCGIFFSEKDQSPFTQKAPFSRKLLDGCSIACPHVYRQSTSATDSHHGFRGVDVV